MTGLAAPPRILADARSEEGEYPLWSSTEALPQRGLDRILGSAKLTIEVDGSIYRVKRFRVDLS